MKGVYTEFDPAVLNPQGGAIAHQLARRGVGQGLALVLER